MRPHRRAGAAGPLRALPPAAPARRAGRGRGLGLSCLLFGLAGSSRWRSAERCHPDCSPWPGRSSVRCRGSRSGSCSSVTFPHSRTRPWSRSCSHSWSPVSRSRGGSPRAEGSSSRWRRVARAILVILGVEAALGWPAAVTPLAGGGQLDGGRFFGMPNIEIGIVLGSAMFLAHRVRVGSGVLLLAACALVAGSPWTGSNSGRRDHALRGSRHVARGSGVAGPGGWPSSSRGRSRPSAWPRSR